MIVLILYVIGLVVEGRRGVVPGGLVGSRVHRHVGFFLLRFALWPLVGRETLGLAIMMMPGCRVMRVQVLAAVRLPHESRCVINLPSAHQLLFTHSAVLNRDQVRRGRLTRGNDGSQWHLSQVLRLIGQTIRKDIDQNLAFQRDDGLLLGPARRIEELRN